MYKNVPTTLSTLRG